MIIFGPVFENKVMEKKQIEQIRMKAIQDFQVNRPYGIRIDFKRRAITLFNRRYNLLGKNENGSIDTLPVEPYDIEDIPLSLAQEVKKSGDIIDLFFYNDETTPCTNTAIDTERLLNYNRRMFALSALLGRKL